MRLNFTKPELELISAALDYARRGDLDRVQLAELGDRLDDALTRYQAAEERIKARAGKPKWGEGRCDVCAGFVGDCKHTKKGADLKYTCHRCGGQTKATERGADLVYVCQRCTTPGAVESGKARKATTPK